MSDPRSARRRAFLFAALAALLGCLGGCAQFLVPQTMALRNAWPQQVPRAIELTQVPFFPQLEYQCGPAALATVMGAAGANVAPAQLVDEVYLPARQGSLQVEMLVAPRRHDMVSYQLAPGYDALLREVAAGNPVLILQDNGIFPFRQWHYAVVAGFDYATGDLLLRSGEERRQIQAFTLFEFNWKPAQYWAMVVLPPERLPATATEASYLPAVVAMDRVASSTAAIRAYQAFLARWPDSEVAGIGLANRLYAAADLDGAEQVLRQALRAHRASPLVLNNLAQVLSDRGRNAEALKLIECAASASGAVGDAVAATRELIAKRSRTQ